MMDKPVTHHRNIIKYKNNEFISTTDVVADEFPLTLYINDKEFATIVCTPEHIEELILGFMASEGVIRKKTDLKDIHIDESKGFTHVTLTRENLPDYEQFTKRMIGSCCGKSRQFYLQNDARTAKVAMTAHKIKPDDIVRLMTTLQENSADFHTTGGLHNAAISDKKDFYLHRADIGRHNALDKLYGHCIKNNIPIRDKVLLFSGRISSEILIKAAKIGVGIILSKSAPTDLAVQLAEDLNITAIGFIRNGGFNIYSHPERVQQ